jgi:hypothetical protein
LARWPTSKTDPLAAKTEMMFMVHCDAPGVELRNPSFSGMGTNTWAVRLTNYFVGEAQLIADGALLHRPHPRRLHPAANRHGLGVTQGAIDSMWTVERTLGHVNEFRTTAPTTCRPSWTT